MQTRVPAAARLLPSFGDVVFLFPLIFLVIRPQGATALLGDGDTGWHLRTGEWILANRAVPHVDLFSFTKPGQPWFAWEWLWDALFAKLHAWGGMAAVLFASMLVISGAFAIVYSLAKRQSGNAVLAAFVTLVGVISSSYHWLARPHLFTLFFAAVFFAVLEYGSRRAILFGLPALMIVWTNLHGGFIAGLIIVATYCLGETARALILADSGPSWKNARLYLQTFAFCAAATLVNPYFYQLHRHILDYFADGYQMKHIAEFQSVSFHDPLSRSFEFLLILGIGAAVLCLARKRFTHFLLIVSWAHMSLVAGRNIAIYAIIAVPLIAWAIQEALVLLERPIDGVKLPGFLTRLARSADGITAIDNISRWHVASVAALGMFAALFFAPAPPPRFEARYDSHSYPERAVRALHNTGFDGRVFSTDVWAGYLIYKLYPEVRVFFDGRSDFYGPAFGDKYTDLLSAKPGWSQNLRRAGVRTVLLPLDSQLTSAMKESHEWRCTYDDGSALVFRSVDPIRTESEQVSAAQVAAGRTATWPSQAAQRQKM